MRGIAFQIEQTVEPVGTVRMALVGELDLASRRALEHRLDELRRQRDDVCLDLSRLDFMDAGGLGILLRALADSRQRAWRLKVEQTLTPQVSRLFEVVGLELA